MRMHKMDQSIGKVYLVGAGPGDPLLISLRAAQCLAQSDVVVYDRLVHRDVLKHAKKDAELFYVGKESSRHTMRQEQINELIVQHALKGKTVCRLKGGDPFVFGRGGEEAIACREANVLFEVVPGVTSAIAAPAYAGIPVTHRNIASSFTVITGHEDPLKNESSIRWKEIATGADTLVFLMGVENLHAIVSKLIENGKSEDTPIALVQWGSWSKQRTLISTLKAVEENAYLRNFTAPCVTIVGDVVRLSDNLRWFEDKPLFGKKIMVTRAREQSSDLCDMLQDLGAEPVEYPMIRILPMVDLSSLDHAIHLFPSVAGLTESGEASSSLYSWVIFTSANAVTIVADRLIQLGYDMRSMAGLHIAAIGPGTAEVLRKHGIRADFVPTRFVAEAILEELPDHLIKGARILLPRASEAREILPQRLTEMGAVTDVTPIYQTVMDDSDKDEIISELAEKAIDVITFASSSTVHNFMQAICEQNIPELIGETVLACIGPITADTLHTYGFAPQIVASEHSIPGLVKEIVAYFTARR